MAAEARNSDSLLGAGTRVRMLLAQSSDASTAPMQHERLDGWLLAAAAPSHSLVVVGTIGDGGISTVSVVPRSSISKLQMVEQAISAKSCPVKLPPIEDEDATSRRIEKLVAQRRIEAARIGKNVTPFAQALFDSLCKIITTCSWDGEDIIVHDVRIRKPYTAECCDGSNPKSLSRVVKILEGARQKTIGNSTP